MSHIKDKYTTLPRDGHASRKKKARNSIRKCMQIEEAPLLEVLELFLSVFSKFLKMF